MRELALKEMDVVAGGFSVGSCSIGAGFSSSKDGKGGSSISGNLTATCNLQPWIGYL